jgi:List-Bact-rpt repeat protein
VSGYYTFQLEVSDGVDTSDRNVLLLAASACDADGNSVVNQTDLDLIQAALGMPALAEDPRDPNHSGIVTLADYNSCKAGLTQYQLTINTAGTGSGTVQPPSGLEPVGTPITLTATPGQCSTFAGFSSNVVNNQITLTGPATVTATFNNATAQQVGLLPVGGTASGQVIASASLNRRVTNTNNWLRSYTLQNTADALSNVYLVLDPPLTNVTALVSSTGTTICTTPEGSWYISIPDLPANATQTVTIEVTTETPTSAWSAGIRILAGGKP